MKEKSLSTNTEKESKLRNTGIFFQSIRKISWYKLIFNLLLKTLKNCEGVYLYASSNTLSSFYLAFSCS